MNTFMNALKNESIKVLTENGSISYNTTLNKVLDLFALGGAYRSRSESDCILLFKEAFDEDATLALKCLFYLRDVRGGQGERRFFRVVTRWLADHETDAMRRNLQYVAEFGRWDDLYTFIGTRLEKDAFQIMRDQLALDVDSKTPSLLAKWLKSENTSSAESRALANKTRQYLGMTHRQYRKTLSILRERIRVLERLMSAGRWDEIEFDKIPSRAGLIYKNAFARRDIIKAKYEAFAKDENTKVNAKVLYPYEVVKQALENANNDVDRAIVNKYWDNLADYINNAAFNGIAVADTSGSMTWGYGSSVKPIEVAISLALYCAEKNTGAFANHFFTFESDPHFLEVKGIDFVDKVRRILRAPWGGSTNVEAVFDKMLAIAKQNHCTQDDIPANVIIISDMEFNSCASSNANLNSYYHASVGDTLFETIEKRWAAAGYKMPRLTFWNVSARNDRIPMRPGRYVNFVSGFSPVVFEQLMQGLSAIDLMLEKLNSERYACIS